MSSNMSGNNSNSDRFAVGSVFQSHTDARTAAIDCAREHNSTVVTIRSDKTKLVLGCKHHGQYRDTRKADKEKAAEAGVATYAGNQRQKDTQRIGCNFRITARRHADGKWYVVNIFDDHNHPTGRSSTVYAQHRKTG